MKSKKCKVCHNKFDPKQSLQIVCSLPCAIEYAKQQRLKKMLKEKKDQKPFDNVSSNRKNLGIEINKLARSIDIYFGFACIDCGQPIGEQGDAAHFHNVGGNDSVRYNLHNIHLARSYCNQYSSEHKKNYPQGLAKRYGEGYLDYLENHLRQDYSYLGLTPPEIAEALKKVRKINRDFETYKLTDPKSARDMFNKIIGIYIK